VGGGLQKKRRKYRKEGRQKWARLTPCRRVDPFFPTQKHQLSAVAFLHIDETEKSVGSGWKMENLKSKISVAKG